MTVKGSEPVNRSEFAGVWDQAAFSIVRLQEADALSGSDHLRALRSLVVTDQLGYPGIRSWFDGKVVHGLSTGERTAYVAYVRGQPVASAILKRGRDTKLCNLRVREEWQGLDLGRILFSLMVLEVRGIATQLHFSLPESLWETKRPFFEAFGFTSAHQARRQYRHGDPELVCSQEFSRVLRSVVQILSNLATTDPSQTHLDPPSLLMSIKPAYWDQIAAGKKTFEFRKRFSNRSMGVRALLYASRPVCSLVGEVKLQEMISGDPHQVWNRCAQGAGVEQGDFEIYVRSAREVRAIQLTDVRPFGRPVPIARLAELLGCTLRPPQSFCHLHKHNSEAWLAAASLARLLQYCTPGLTRA
jgi:predicted transcriptional regulator/GNAT superfamily N-acetyltransferase